MSQAEVDQIIAHINKATGYGALFVDEQKQPVPNSGLAGFIVRHENHPSDEPPYLRPLDRIMPALKAIKEMLNAAPGTTLLLNQGDLDAIAKKVADELAERMAD